MIKQRVTEKAKNLTNSDELRWEYRVQQVKEFVQEHGHGRVPTRYPRTCKLVQTAALSLQSLFEEPARVCLKWEGWEKNKVPYDTGACQSPKRRWFLLGSASGWLGTQLPTIKKMQDTSEQAHKLRIVEMDGNATLSNVLVETWENYVPKPGSDPKAERYWFRMVR
eukprot:CAMPEP_0168215124 /NCGR_PEP_ID=MMETSP0140_2-20121125/5740_1 /TAXON_ID=44445 /ORGANISM="Pseudo-nitzschia australis, Strain 10249 10 AB" /LENGTH=165 /DNA_ID=CAMNT_0008142179 /DNA_START=36 /DNA_END=533 /DNA_ORIENTATION=+